MATPATLLMIALISVATSTHACIHEFGTIAEAAALAGAHYTYSYNGLDWPNTFTECRGTRQSPVLLPGSGAAAQALGQPDAKSNFSYGTLSNAKVVNNGRTLQVSLPADFTSDVKIPIKGAASNATHLSVLNGKGEVSYVKATPAQFHFHSTSEHIMSGAEYPLEMHIVHFVKKDQLAACEDPGCPLVLGIFMSLTMKEDEVKPELRKLIGAMPFHEGRTANISGDLDVGALLPEERSYFTYEGSLTTPPCTEGILWHVLTTPIKISRSLLTKYKEAVGDLYCQEEDDKKEEDGKKDAERDNDTKLVNGTYFRLPPANKDGCVKLANGNNYREVQPINDRPIKLAT